MKTTILTTLLMMTIPFVGFAQQEVVQDFESSPTVAGFEGLTSATIISDPSSAGNGQVFELVTSTSGNPWQGAEVILADDSSLDLTTDLTVSVDVWSDVAFSPMAKVETTGSAAPAPFAANTQSHTGSGWETLTFTFNTGDDGTATADGIYNKVAFFPNRSSDGNAWNDPIIDGTFYFDNITGVKGTITTPTDNPPTTAAPTPPTRDAANVISLFSNAYTDITVDSWSATWDDSSIEDVVIEGNDTKKITFNNFLGVDFATNPFDASGMTHFHMDYWTAETDLIGKVLNPKWSNHLGGSGETNAFDLTNPVPETATGQWVSVDVPISDFTVVTNADMTAFAQFLLTSNLDVVYVDNIYLYNDGSGTGGGGGTTEPQVAAPTPPDRTGELISVFSEAYTDITGTNFNPDWGQATVVTEEQIEGNATLKYANLNYQGTQFASPLDLTTVDNMHIDMWTGDATSINVSLISSGPVETAYSLDVTQNEWVDYEIPLTEFSNVVDLTDVIQIKIDDGGAGDSPTIYIDNIYFYSGVATSIDDTDELPNNFTLDQNYPNPFNPTTNISYTLPANAEVTLEVFNVQGQRVATLVDAFQSTGSYNVTFDASNLASGLYTYRLTTGNSVQVKKMMLIK